MENVEGIIHLEDLVPCGMITEDVVLFIHKNDVHNKNAIAVQINFYMRKIDPVQTITQYKKTQQYKSIDYQLYDGYYHFLLMKKFETKEIARLIMNFTEAIEKRKDLSFR